MNHIRSFCNPCDQSHSNPFSKVQKRILILLAWDYHIQRAIAMKKTEILPKEKRKKGKYVHIVIILSPIVNAKKKESKFIKNKVEMKKLQSERKENMKCDAGMQVKKLYIDEKSSNNQNHSVQILHSPKNVSHLNVSHKSSQGKNENLHYFNDERKLEKKLIIHSKGLSKSPTASKNLLGQLKAEERVQHDLEDQRMMHDELRNPLNESREGYSKRKEPTKIAITISPPGRYRSHPKHVDVSTKLEEDVGTVRVRSNSEDMNATTQSELSLDSDLEKGKKRMV